MRTQAEKPLTSVTLFRNRVIYLGRKTSTETKNGLESVQEPLKFLYSDENANKTVLDVWLSVTACGLQSEECNSNKENNEENTCHFFPIENLHYCAAVRFVDVAVYADNDNNDKNENCWKKAKFLPLDNPLASLNNNCQQHPPLFVAVVGNCRRRSVSGRRRVAELFDADQCVSTIDCIAFVCQTAEAANAFVRYCFRAYADSVAACEISNSFEPNIGMAGELSGAVARENGDDPEIPKKSNGGTDGEDVTTTVDKSKSGRRWSNIKSKYYYKFRKKNVVGNDSVSDDNKLSKSSDQYISNADNNRRATTTGDENEPVAEEPTGSFQRMFKKNKKRLSQSDANLNATHTANKSVQQSQQQQQHQRQYSSSSGCSKAHETPYNNSRRRHFSCHQLPFQFARVIPIVHPRSAMTYCSFLEFPPPAHYPYFNAVPPTAFYSAPVYAMFPPYQQSPQIIGPHHHHHHQFFVNSNVTTSTDNEDSSDCSYDSNGHVTSHGPYFYHNKINNKSLPVARHDREDYNRNNTVGAYGGLRNGNANYSDCDNIPPGGAARFFSTNKADVRKPVVNERDNNDKKSFLKRNEVQHKNERAASFKTTVQRQKSYSSSPNIFYEPSSVLKAGTNGSSRGKALEKFALLRQRQDCDYSSKALNGNNGCFEAQNGSKTVEERIHRLNISEGDDDEFRC